MYEQDPAPHHKDQSPHAVFTRAFHRHAYLHGGQKRASAGKRKHDDDDDDDRDDRPCDWDTSLYETHLKALRTEVRAHVVPACSNKSVDHAARVLLAIQSLEAVCKSFRVPSGIDPACLKVGTAYDNPALFANTKALECETMRLQVQCLRPALRALQGAATLCTRFPTLWEALEEYLAAGLGAPLYSSIDLVPGGAKGVAQLPKPDDIVKTGTVGTAIVAHAQCFAGDASILLPKALAAYQRAVSRETTAVQQKVLRALDASGRGMATSLLGPANQQREQVLAAVNATAALMKYEIQTLVGTRHRNCLVE